MTTLEHYYRSTYLETEHREDTWPTLRQTLLADHPNEESGALIKACADAQFRGREYAEDRSVSGLHEGTLMSLPGLRSLSITNFRSIFGTVVVPVDAQVVLVHGPNGTGKTSIISALELTLTGGISELPWPQTRHLVHHGTSQATIELTTTSRTTRTTASTTQGPMGRHC